MINSLQCRLIKTVLDKNRNPIRRECNRPIFGNIHTYGPNTKNLCNYPCMILRSSIDLTVKNFQIICIKEQFTSLKNGNNIIDINQEK